MMTLRLSSAATIMWYASARELGLTPKGLRSEATLRLGTQDLIHYVAPKSFSIGGLQFSQAQFYLASNSGTVAKYESIPIVGYLGMDSFAQVDFELDLSHRQLNLYSQDHCPGTVVYWTDSYSSTAFVRGVAGNAYFPMELDGKRVQAAFNTSFAATTLTTDVTKILYGFDEHSEDIETEHYSNGGVSFHYRAMALTTAGLSIPNAKVQLVPGPAHCSLDTGHGPSAVAQYSDCAGKEAPLLLGLAVIIKLHLYFATKENVLYYSAADAPTPAAHDLLPPPAQ